MVDRKYIMSTIIVIVISFNLRAPITCVGSLVNEIQYSLDLSPQAAGFITTIPLLMFAVISPLAVLSSDRLGMGITLTAGFAFMCGGLILRSYAGPYGMFIGTIMIGEAIGIGNVMLPAIIKSEFPEKIETMTSLYTVIMQIVSASGTAISIPIASAYGWDDSLFIWILPAAFALLMCAVNRSFTSANSISKGKKIQIWRKAKTWWVTFYMGIQSFLFYCFIAWLSPVLQSRGFDSEFSGYLLSVYVIMGMAGSAFLPFLMKKNNSQASTGTQIGIIYAIGMMSVDLFNNGIMLIIGIVVCGFCSGMCISFAMALFGLHTENSRDASRLSGFAQSAGYLIAASGPVLCGKIYGFTESFEIPLLILSLSAALLVFVGRKAGKEEII